jgi:Flp pilus assembly protein TadG
VVEFALIIPFLLLLMMGILEFGWLVYNNMTIINGAREGARSASLGNATSTVSSVVATRIAPLTATTTIKHSVDGGITYVTTTDSAGSNNAPAKALVQVKVVYRFKPLTGIFPFLRNRDLTASAEFGRE